MAGSMAAESGAGEDAGGRPSAPTGSGAAAVAVLRRRWQAAGMDVDDARAFLADHHRAVLVTRRADGGLQASPVSAGVDADGAAVISTTEATVKTRNARRDPRVSLCVLSDGFGPWVQIDGRAEVVPLPEAMERLVDLYRQVAGEHPDWDDFRAAMERDRRVALRIVIERAGPDRRG